MAESQSPMLPSQTPAAAVARPTRARLMVLFFLCSLSFILYLDRVCFSKAESSIRRDLGLKKDQTGYIMAAFTLAYGLFEIPTGRWGDRLGSRAVLTRISTWWSLFTALTAGCSSFSSMLAVRFVFGAGEAGAYPNAARVISRWFPRPERGRAQGVLQTSALVGGALAQGVTGVLISHLGWRWPFVIYGVIGVVWAFAFWLWFRDDPADHSWVNEAERRIITSDEPTRPPVHEAIPWRDVFSSRGIRLLSTIMMCSAFNSYVYFSWFPSYLEEGRQVQSTLSGWLSSTVLFCSALGNLLGGFAADQLVRHSRNPIRSRQQFGCVCYLSAASLLVVGITRHSAIATTVLVGLSILCVSLTISNWWSCAIEISGKHIGALFGLMNGLGAFGAMASPTFFGMFSQWREEHGYIGRDQWDPAFFVVAGVLAFASICWLFVDSSRAVDSEQNQIKSQI